MEIPRAFLELVRRFDSESIPKPFDEQVWISNIVSRLDDKAKGLVRKYLNELFSTNPTDAELQRIWRSAPPEFLLSDDHLRTLLGMIRNSI